MDRGMLLIEHRTLFQISFKLEGKDIEIGEKYTCTYSRNGIVKLQINGFTAADVAKILGHLPDLVLPKP